MASKAYIVKFKPPALGVVHTVNASTVEIHDEHLIFWDSEGKLAALFLLEIVYYRAVRPLRCPKAKCL